jgi:hypothetical protein
MTATTKPDTAYALNSPTKKAAKFDMLPTAPRAAYSWTTYLKTY